MKPNSDELHTLSSFRREIVKIQNDPKSTMDPAIPYVIEYLKMRVTDIEERL